MKNAESAHHKQQFTMRLAGLIALLALPQIGRAQYFELHTLAQFDGTNGSSPSALRWATTAAFTAPPTPAAAAVQGWFLA